MAVDEADLIEETETKEPSTTKTKEGLKERKMYKGEILNAQVVNDRLAQSKVLAIQPVQRKYKMHGFEQTLPPSFVVTKFTPSISGYQMTFFSPANGMKGLRDIPKDLELNVLNGQRAFELYESWNKAVETNFGNLNRRLTCTIGADPEIFVVDSKGEMIPAWEFLPAKAKPLHFQTADSYFKGTAYWDGFQAEFTTQAGLACLAQMSDNVQAGLKAIQKAARLHNPKATLSLSSVLMAKDEVLAKAAPEHVAFGCAPSKNAYGLTGNIREGREVPYRFAGGHIHFGSIAHYGEEKLRRVVRVLDAVLGVAAVSMFDQFDNPVRRQYYGLPGEYRLPPHGLEYRTLSNAWLAHPLVFNMTFDLARAAAGLVDENMDHLWKATEAEVVETIMNHDVPRAREILARNSSLFKGILQTIGGTYMMHKDAPEIVAKCWANGMGSFVANPKDIDTNWKLSGVWVAHNEGDNANLGRALPTLRVGGKV